MCKKSCSKCSCKNNEGEVRSIAEDLLKPYKGQFYIWEIVHSPNGYDFVFGKIKNDPTGRWDDDDFVATSEIVKRDPGNRWVATRNSVYMLNQEKV